jgi:hypothetical protein
LNSATVASLMSTDSLNPTPASVPVISRENIHPNVTSTHTVSSASKGALVVRGRSPFRGATKPTVGPTVTAAAATAETTRRGRRQSSAPAGIRTSVSDDDDHNHHHDNCYPLTSMH